MNVTRRHFVSATSEADMWLNLIWAGVALLFLGMSASAVFHLRWAQRLGWPASAAVLTPFIYLVLFYAMLRSAWVTVRQGGVCWRETFYPLNLLRRSAVR